MWDFSPLAWQRRAGRALCLYLLAFLTAILFLPAGSGIALDTSVVGRGGIPEVEIDLSAIEFPRGRVEDSVSIGTFQSKDLLMPGSRVAPGKRIVLTPPGSQPATKVPKVKLPREGHAKASAPRLKFNIPKISSMKPVMPKPPRAKPHTPAKAKKQAPDTTTETAATPPEPPPSPEVDTKPEPAPKVPATTTEALDEAKPAPVAPPPPPPDTVAVDSESLIPPPPLSDLPDPPPPPPTVGLELPPPPEGKVEGAVANLQAPPPVEELAKSGDAAEPAPVREPAPPQPQKSSAPEESEQVVTVPPPSTAAPSTGPMTVLFSPGSAALNTKALEHIAAIREKIEVDRSLRLQLVAYATNTDDNPSRARRLSLSRALVVRSHLVEKGVESTRVDIRALGNKSGETLGDRVDLVLLP